MAANLANPVKVLICRIKQKMPPDEALHCFICQGNTTFNLHVSTACALSWFWLSLCTGIKIMFFFLRMWKTILWKACKQSLEVAGRLLCWYLSGKQEELPRLVLLPSSLELMESQRCALSECFLTLFLEEHQLIAPSNTCLIAVLPCCLPAVPGAGWADC